MPPTQFAERTWTRRLTLPRLRHSENAAGSQIDSPKAGTLWTPAPEGTEIQDPWTEGPFGPPRPSQSPSRNPDRLKVPSFPTEAEESSAATV